VFYTVLGDDVERTATAMALESAKGVLRSAVGRQTGVKFTPTLTFQADVVPETAREITDLLAKAREADEELQRRAAGAQYAGDADPYRITDTEGDGDGDGGTDTGAVDTGGDAPAGEPATGGAAVGVTVEKDETVPADGRG
jgi:ribosome-binding factor A